MSDPLRVQLRELCARIDRALDQRDLETAQRLNAEARQLALSVFGVAS